MNTDFRTNFRPPIISFVMAAGLFIAGLVFSNHPKFRPSEWSGVLLIALTFGAARAVVKGFDDYSKSKNLKKKRQTLEAAKKLHGGARFAEEKDIEAAGLFNPEGVFLGTLPTSRKRTRDLRYGGDCSVNIVSPPGGSKSLAIAVTTLLTELNHSRIVCDPSGELYSLTHSFLEQQKHIVKTICAWPDETSARLGLKIVDSGFDLFYDYDPKMKPVKVRSYIQRKVQLILPRKSSEKSDEKSNFFRLRGLDLLVFLAFYLVWKKTKPSLPLMRSLLMEGLPALRERLVEASSSDAFGGSLRELANSLLGTMNESSEQFSGYLGVAENALTIYGAGDEMGIHTAKSFDPRTLKDDRSTTLFVIYPRDYARSHQQSLNLTFSTLFEAVAADPRHKTVTAIMDEIAACGYLGNLLPALNEYRKYGLRLVCFWQDLLGGQAEAIYSRSGMQQIVSAAPVLAAFNVNNYETLELLSKMSGTVAQETASVNVQSRWNTTLPDAAMSHGHQNRPLLYPDDIRRLPQDEMLIFTGNTPVIKAKKVPYYTRPEFKQKCGHNPYFHD